MIIHKFLSKLSRKSSLFQKVDSKLESYCTYLAKYMVKNKISLKNEFQTLIEANKSYVDLSPNSCWWSKWSCLNAFAIEIESTVFSLIYVSSVIEATL